MEKSSVLWNNFLTGFWLPLDSEVPESVKQTIRSKKSMLTFLFNSYAFSAMNIFPQNTHFKTQYFIGYVVIQHAKDHST
jgi:hypothetical protein